jgi:magnesium transporter
MSSKNNVNINVINSDKKDGDISSHNLMNTEDTSTKQLLGSNNLGPDYQKSSSQLSFKSYSEPESIQENVGFNSKPEYINIPTNVQNPYDIGNISPILDCSSFMQNNDGRKLKNFYNDICIPLHKINGDLNVEEFYKVDYEQFQEFCDKPSKVKSIPYHQTELDKLRRRKSSHYKNHSNSENYNTIKVSNEPLNISKKLELNSAERILFYCKDSDTNNHVQRVGNFQQLKPVGNEPISEAMKRTFFWIDVTSPTKEEIAVLSDVFGIHPLTVEDMEYDDTREKMDTFLNYYFICVNSFEENTFSDIQPINVSILVFKNFVLSFHSKPTVHPDNILRRMIQLSFYDFKIDGDWIAYAHIDDITDAFIPYVNSVEIDVNGIDELVLILKESEQSDMLRRIGLARKHVTTLLRLSTEKIEVIKNLIKRITTLNPRSNNLLYLSDVQDHVISMVQNLHHYDQTLTRAHSNYLAQISIETTLAANDTNDIANKLSVLGTVFLPLSLISGMWGMNVIVPGQNYDSLIPFIVICISMVIISVLVVIASKRFGMI